MTEPCPRQRSPGSGPARARRLHLQQRAGRRQLLEQVAQHHRRRAPTEDRAALLTAKRSIHRRVPGGADHAAEDGAAAAARRLKTVARRPPGLMTQRMARRAVAAHAAGAAAAGIVAEGEDAADPRRKGLQERRQEEAGRATVCLQTSTRVCCQVPTSRTRRPPPGRCQRFSSSAGGRSGLRWAHVPLPQIAHASDAACNVHSCSAAVWCAAESLTLRKGASGAADLGRTKAMTHCSGKRVQMPEEELPTYVKGQHLRGIDATIVDQVSAEMVSELP